MLLVLGFYSLVGAQSLTFDNDDGGGSIRQLSNFEKIVRISSRCISQRRLLPKSWRWGRRAIFDRGRPDWGKMSQVPFGLGRNVTVGEGRTFRTDRHAEELPDSQTHEPKPIIGDDDGIDPATRSIAVLDLCPESLATEQ